MGWHVCKVGSRFAALELIAQGLGRLYGSVEADMGRGLAPRMDHGSQYLSDHFLNQVRYWGIHPSFGFLEEPETPIGSSSAGIAHSRSKRSTAGEALALVVGGLAAGLLLTGTYQTIQNALVCLVGLMSIVFCAVAGLTAPDIGDLIAGVLIPACPPVRC